MAKTKEISRRIKSVSSTRKITNALEMVAAAKMKKAVEATLKTRTYANLSWETVLRLTQQSAQRSELTHPLLRSHDEFKKAAIILITSNRGMCGGYNSLIINAAQEAARGLNVPTDFILVGTRGNIIRHHGHTVTADFEKSDLVLDSREIYPVVRMITEDYQKHRYDRILVAYTDFVSAAKQVPRVKQLLPVELDGPDKTLGVVGEDPAIGSDRAMIEDKSRQHLSGDGFTYDYTFEPSPRLVLDRLIPRLLEIQLYQAFLEANASEHSARMTAMHQATEAADDMVKELTLFYNKARQAGITAEIAEISAGANALAE